MVAVQVRLSALMVAPQLIEDNGDRWFVETVLATVLHDCWLPATVDAAPAVTLKALNAKTVVNLVVTTTMR